MTPLERFDSMNFEKNRKDPCRLEAGSLLGELNRFNVRNFSAAPNLRQKLRVRMINAQGLEEAGVDGGGVFRSVVVTLL